MTLHFSQIGLTLGFTFIAVPSSHRECPEVLPGAVQREIVEAILCLLVPVHDASAREIVRRQLDDHTVLGQDADVVLAHLAGDVGENLMAVGQLDAECSVRQSLDHGSLDLDDPFFFGHIVRNLFFPRVGIAFRSCGADPAWTGSPSPVRGSVDPDRRRGYTLRVRSVSDLPDEPDTLTPLGHRPIGNCT